jgi:hypothetical protein
VILSKDAAASSIIVPEGELIKIFRVRAYLKGKGSFPEDWGPGFGL